MSKLIFREAEFEHQPSVSVYNHNHYKHIKLGYTILEICHEDYNYFSFYLIEDEKEIFLGNNTLGLWHEIEFKTEFT